MKRNMQNPGRAERKNAPSDFPRSAGQGQLKRNGTRPMPSADIQNQPNRQTRQQAEDQPVSQEVRETAERPAVADEAPAANQNQAIEAETPGMTTQELFPQPPVPVPPQIPAKEQPPMINTGASPSYFPPAFAPVPADAMAGQAPQPTFPMNWEGGQRSGMEYPAYPEGQMSQPGYPIHQPMPPFDPNVQPMAGFAPMPPVDELLQAAPIQSPQPMPPFDPNTQPMAGFAPMPPVNEPLQAAPIQSPQPMPPFDPNAQPMADFAPMPPMNEPLRVDSIQLPPLGPSVPRRPRPPVRQKNGPPPKKKRSKGAVFLNILCIFLAIVVGLVGGAMVYVGDVFSWIGTEAETPEEDFKGVDGNVSFELNSGDTVMNEFAEVSTTSTLRSDPMVQNILLLGSDKREGLGETGWRADTIIILSIDKRHKTLKMSSILRDTYVSIPGYGSDRINSAYAYGGATLVMKTIESNFGIKIDRYATVNFRVFIKIVDQIGGIDLEITAREAKEINQRAMTQPTVSAGFMHLGGWQTLEYVRIRKIDDDFVRTSRQRKALEIILNEMKGLSLGEIHDVLYETLPQLSTNLSQEEVLSLVAEVSTILQYPLESVSIPYNNTWQGKKIRGMDVLVVNMEENRRILGQFIFESGISKYYGYTYNGYTYGYGYGNGYGYGYYSTRPAEDSAEGSEGPQSSEGDSVSVAP